MDPIINSVELSAFCTRAAKSKFITVDTEFIRDRTYWPRLCLVQIATENEAVIIDAVAPDIDLAALFDLMADTGVLKVFHAARQDVEIFVHLADMIPTPIFDTQVAAMVCGFGDSVGYDKLVASLVKEHIDKSLRFTDWSRRPLSDKQLNYALSDVTHLRVVYEKLAARLEENRRESWIDEEMEILTTPSTYRQDPNLSWRRIKSRLRKSLHLAILRELAAWREVEAQNRDVPRNRVLRDDALTDIAAHEPATVADLFGLRSMSREKCGNAVAEAVIEVIAKAKALPASEHPKVQHNRNSQNGMGPAGDLLKVLLKLRCEQNNVALKLIATADDIDSIARDDDADVPALHGWRRELFGQDALDLKHGKLALAADGSALKVISIKP
jgi:ribonuclease D